MKKVNNYRILRNEQVERKHKGKSNTALRLAVAICYNGHIKGGEPVSGQICVKMEGIGQNTMSRFFSSSQNNVR